MTAPHLDLSALLASLGEFERVSGTALRAVRAAEKVCRRLRAAADAGLRSMRSASAVLSESDLGRQVEAINEQAQAAADFRVRLYGWPLTSRAEELRDKAGQSAQLVREVTDLVAALLAESHAAWMQASSAVLDLGVVGNALNDAYGETLEMLEEAAVWARGDLAEVRMGVTSVKRWLRSPRWSIDVNVTARIADRRADLLDEQWDHGGARDLYAQAVQNCEQLPGLLDWIEGDCDDLIEALRHLEAS